MLDKYYISGKEYGKRELISHLIEKLATEELPLWESEIYEFILQWFDDRDYVVAYTSGSTGKPKQMKLSKQLMRCSARSTVGFLGLKKGDTALLCLSANYIAGKMMIVRALEHGLHLVFCEPKVDALKYISEEIDFCAMVPYQVTQSLEKCPQLYSNIKKLIIGGGSVGNELLEKLQNIDTLCYSTYGMTETMSHIALMRLNGERENVYRCLPNIKISLDDRDCLVVDFWGGEKIVTNDIVELFNDNSFVWKGRYDNVINSGGIKFFPESLEQKVSEIFEDRFIFSSEADEKLGERIILVIESKPYSGKRLTALSEKLKTKLGKYEMPKRIVFVEEFKETTSGKIIRNGIF